MYTKWCTLKCILNIIEMWGYFEKARFGKELTALGWRFYKHGGGHDHWTNGKEFESIPRHNEIKENLARKILKTAMNNSPKE